MSDYQQIAGVINYLNEHYTEQPSLARLADVVGLSPYHFQRKFTHWVGVSPKSYLQYLTLKNARELLDQGESVMKTAYATGLSGASRLHDLCVTLEAASPGEIKLGGRGLKISYDFGFSPFGECLVAMSPRGILHLAFVTDNRQAAIEELRSEWPNASLEYQERSATGIIQQVFNINNNQPSPLHAYVKGTKFQVRVWRALLQIAPGQLITYGQLATRIRHPRASRAVGTAVGKNPLACLIPCHRVIRGTGVIGHYRWGPGRKRTMIACEFSQSGFHCDHLAK